MPSHCIIISRVLIYSGSAINACLIMTLCHIGFDDSLIRPSGMMVQAFGGTKTSACGEIDLKVLICPCEFEISFVVVDVPAVFSLLLAHRYIRLEPFRPVYIMESNLCQAINLIYDGRGGYPFTCFHHGTIHRHATDGSVSKYHSFEFVTVNYILEGGIFLEQKLSRMELMIRRYLIRRQYEPGTGLISTKMGFWS